MTENLTYYERNRERVTAYQREYQRGYRERNRERLQEYHRVYYQTHAEELKAYQRRRYAARRAAGDALINSILAKKGTV